MPKTRYSSRLKQKRKRSKFWKRLYSAEDKLKRAIRSGTSAEIQKHAAEIDRLSFEGAGRVSAAQKKRNRQR